LVDRQFKETYLSEILMNGEIWTRSPPADTLKIFSHWTEVLFNCSREVMVTVRPFSVLLCDINRYLDFAREDELDIVACRNILKRLLFLIAHISFTRHDFQELVYQCIKSQSNRVSADLLVIVRMLSEVVGQVGLEFWDIARLTKLAARNDSSLTIEIGRASCRERVSS
jgi:hypothetical protein